MIFEFLPPLFPGRNLPGNVSSTGGPPENPLAPPGRPVGARLIFGLTAVVVLLSLLVLMRAGWPSIDPTADALRPQSPAYTALDQIQANLNQKREPIWLIIGGRTEDEAAGRLEEIQPVLRDAVSNHVIAGFTLPASLWPRPRFQAENRGTALHLAAERGALRDAASAAGFLQSSLGLTEKILDDWQAAGTNRGAFQPTNSTSRWIFDRVMARTPTNYFALGLLTPADGPGATRLVAVESDLARDGVWPSDWNLLGRAIFSRVKTNLWRVVAPMVVLVLLSLWLAFRRPVEILLSLTVLLLSGLVLLAAMREAGWSWNLLNLMAIPLILGTGVDYSIFMQLALRRYEGDLGKAYHSVGRALLLCGGTAVGAFGSLTFSSNSGLASLGRVCAIGIASNMLIAVFLLPVWWRTSVLKARGCAIGQNK
jgi:predicted exporter